MNRKMTNVSLILFTLFLCSDATIIESDRENATITVIEEKANATARVEVRTVEKPHHLFIGRCYPFYPVLHQEIIDLSNDGRSHVSAVIRVNIQGEAYITCVNVFDETGDGNNGYPRYIAGGIGMNFVEFGVVTEYGKGFQFYVQVFGYSSRGDFKRGLKIP